MAEHGGQELPPRYNIGPTQQLYTVTHDHHGRTLEAMRWGLVPAGSKKGVREQGSRPWFNGRREQIDQQSGAGHVYRMLITRRRCLVPFDVFYEWQGLPQGGKQPYAITPDEDRVHAFAGIFDEWHDEEGGVVKSCLIFTRPAEPLMAFIHNAGARKHRQPVILPRGSWDAWLDPSSSGDDALAMLDQQPPSLQATPITSAVSKGVEGPQVLEAAGETITQPGTLDDPQGNLFG